jgi:hypothetical protein
VKGKEQYIEDTYVYSIDFVHVCVLVSASTGHGRYLGGGGGRNCRHHSGRFMLHRRRKSTHRYSSKVPILTLGIEYISMVSSVYFYGIFCRSL